MVAKRPIPQKGGGDDRDKWKTLVRQIYLSMRPTQEFWYGIANAT